MIFSSSIQDISPLRQKIVDHTVMDENKYLDYLLQAINPDSTSKPAIEKLAGYLVQQVRQRQAEQRGILVFIRQYNLSTEEGVVLMCLAEALLRIPDAATANKLIKDKLSNTNWEQHLGESHSLFVNASTWGLMLSGKLVNLDSKVTKNFNHYFYSLIGKSTEPVIRTALKEAMRIMGQQFVIAETIENAVNNNISKNKTFSFDMLGEAAITNQMAEDFFKSYLQAINVISSNATSTDLTLSNSISIKLSALHPRYELSQRHKLIKELYPKLKRLIESAIQHNIAITIDAEESDRLDIMLDAFEYMYRIAVSNNWSGMGLAVQAYQYRSLPIIEWLNKLSCDSSCLITVRLVKGAYWDTEIKLAQQLGFEYYPVFTRKENTDLSYLCCAQRLLRCDKLYPQFATHNAHTIASIILYSKTRNSRSEITTPKFEFQRLFGMGELLYDSLAKEYNIPCRIYAPVGPYKTLLSYLVRRLLENGANTSFVQRIENTEIAIASIVKSPIDQVKQNTNHYHPDITLPANLFPDNRINASGINLSDMNCLNKINTIFIKKYTKQSIVPAVISPIINGKSNINATIPRHKINSINPADKNDLIATIELANENDITSAVESAQNAFQEWSTVDANIRANYFLKLSDLIEENKIELVSVIVREAGRCIPDAVSEIRETIDFCRYYAKQSLVLFQGKSLDGPTGETNILQFKPRGIYVCISPWNFPMAIFTGQLVAALVTGNCVLAKPAQQTSLCAYEIIKLCYRAGIPHSVLHFIPASSNDISVPLLNHPNISGVVFTGSLTSANNINSVLSKRTDGIIPLIAETSGMNTMIVDSSALVEQVVTDVIRSAFNSAGQRCSSLRVLFLQDEIADTIIELLLGAVKELMISDPKFLSTDLGPLIDTKSLDKIKHHNEFLSNSDFAKCIIAGDVVKNCNGFFISPSIYEITRLAQIPDEVFGPVLHIIRYPQSHLSAVISEINNSGYGLTLGIHSRIASTIDKITTQTKVGNIYINRNIIGAVVGVQPFGGVGRSGTGPKSGGPNYLASFCTEQVISHNITAIGGNTQLLSLNPVSSD